MSAPVLVWFRLDLRLADNPALEKALSTGAPVIPVFIWAPEEEAPWAPGGASRWWLHQSLAALDGSLHEQGSRLILRTGPTGKTLRGLAAETGATAIFWNRRFEPAVIARDRGIKEHLRTAGLIAESCTGNVLMEPGKLLNSSGAPFQVFTPFWRAVLATGGPPAPVKAPESLKNPSAWPDSLKLADFELEPKMDWAGGLRETWTPGERGAADRLEEFLAHAVTDYSEDRDRPDHSGTSRLSPHLHFGEITARQVWHAVQRRLRGKGGEPYLRQIAWREFSYHLLFHFPHTAEEPLRPAFRDFPWQPDPKMMRAWSRGETGYPLVDAGMHELWHTGWMHNRVRLVTASFLVKHLLIPWQHGAAWFWDTLVDADLANNTMGWQWVAGCGADAAPYFRIFNPDVQAKKFDPERDYIRRWAPEPRAPIIDHKFARERALEALGRTRTTSRP